MQIIKWVKKRHEPATRPSPDVNQVVDRGMRADVSNDCPMVVERGALHLYLAAKTALLAADCPIVDYYWSYYRQQDYPH